MYYHTHWHKVYHRQKFYYLDLQPEKAGADNTTAQICLKHANQSNIQYPTTMDHEGYHEFLSDNNNQQDTMRYYKNPNYFLCYLI